MVTVFTQHDVHVDCLQLVPWLREMLSSLQLVLISRSSSQTSAATHRQPSPTSTDTGSQAAELLVADINKKKVKTKKI